MLNSPTASETQELVFDNHFNRIASQLNLILQQHSTLVALVSFKESLIALQPQRDLFDLKAKAKNLIQELKLETSILGFISTFSKYLDKELTLLECFVSKIEEVRLDYIRQNRTWVEAARNLGPILAECRARKDLDHLRKELLQFCQNQLVGMAKTSKTFKPKLEAIANEIPSKECLMAAESALPSDTFELLNFELKELTEKFIALKVETAEVAANNQSLLRRVKKDEGTIASLSLELQMARQEVVSLKLAKQEDQQKATAVKQAAAPKKEAGFFSALFGSDSDDESSKQPILHAKKEAAKNASTLRAPAKPPAAVPPVVQMNDGGKTKLNAVDMPK